MRLKEKVVIVTGAGRGIGREICLRVADEGARICACDLDRKCLEELAGEMKAGNKESIPSGRSGCARGRRCSRKTLAGTGSS